VNATLADDAMTPLDWPRLPLAGRVLIEASAGTGKTHTLGLLYLRLLLEGERSVEQILVATFSEAAAQELRLRLRSRIGAAARRLARQAPADAASADPALEAWLAGIEADETRRTTALRRLRLAELDFDRAPIATIHALCQRIQRDFPFASQTPFAGAELLDERELLRECVEDFWRRRYLAGAVDADEAELVLPHGPEALLHDLEALLAADGALLPCDGRRALADALAELRRPEWIAELRRLAGDAVLDGSKRALRNRLTAIADALEAGAGIDTWLCGSNGKVFEAGELAKQLKPGLDPRTIPVLDRLLRLRQLVVRRAQFVRGEVLGAAFEYCRDEVPRRAVRREGQTYAMQIDAVHRRLCGAAADAELADELFAAFPVALIDEFQDTDRRQFAIFDRIYRDAGGAARGLLVMIGDPKQAIYGFRGGDIAAYLSARAAAPQRCALTENFRSAPALVAACNELYAAAGDGFANDAIRYRPVRARGPSDRRVQRCGKARVAAPFALHRFAATGDKVAEREMAALVDCANRIAELLGDPRQRLGERALAPGDIAVLVPTNAQVATLRRLLAERGVPCVGGGRASVFAGDSARELLLILSALRDPNDDRALRAALATRLCGADFSALRRWLDDSAAFERQRDRFVDWRALVETRGVLAWVQALLAERAAALLALPDGERVVTDLRHLGELLAEEEASRHGLDALCARLATLRREEDADSEAAEARRLRLESDAARVQLMTLHAAKGLEFPIVFLPLLWRVNLGSRSAEPSVLRFHDANGRLCFDIGSARFDEHRAAHHREQLEERLRLLYVALTRAQHALHVYWGEDESFDGGKETWKTSALERLLGRALAGLGLPGDATALPKLARRLSGVRIVGPYQGPRPCYTPAQAKPAIRAAREPLPEPRRPVWLHSFSALARSAPPESESAAADEAETEEAAPWPSAEAEAAAASATDAERPVEPEDSELLALEPWRGRRFGNAVHRLLEIAAPQRIWPDQRELVAAELARQAARPQAGEADAALAAVGRMLDRVRAADLGAGLRLDRLAREARVAEFEFLFPVASLPLERLRTICAAHACADVVPSPWGAIELNGLVAGFADLVFCHEGRYHVLDYKSNRLGTRLGDYADAALAQAMTAHHYPLQALLYVFALHRHLRARLPGYAPERDLGESWYVFVRAAGLAPGLGVWRRRWPVALLEALDDAFAGAREAA